MTYSIVARDEKTGELGVAVQSHYFSVGSIVSWARSGVGAVATQSNVELTYGPLGLELMGSGKSAPEALDALLRADPKAEHRQVAMVDSGGHVAAHTGTMCIPFAGHALGNQCSCQANIMRTEKVWGSMCESFEGSEGSPLAERLVAALDAGEAAGGDARGKQSAALLTVSKDAAPNYWSGKLVDLRVEDHPDPLPELRRLLRYQRGYDWVSRGDDHLAARRYAEALTDYRRGLEIVPEVEELRYWVGLGMLMTEERDQGLQMLKEILQNDPGWVQVTRGLLSIRSMPIDPSLFEGLI
ncbi:MAG TPA: DUF1028 domain-containing protein [Nitrososphaerales archaeon]|nr:DUF1028 domain-containing protein [Nitrososphaerales archaeon]HUK74686.1 DUF1028 domain-containing protein [Nitrososphaerales archaeon]